MQSFHFMMRGEPSKAKLSDIDRSGLRRIVGFARPYRRLIVGFLVSIVFSALLGTVPALLFRALIDDAIPERNRGLLSALALGAVGVALAAAGLGLLQRWFSSRVGEGLIYDLRSSLYDHVQRMPVDFFTRTQTGALISRLNNDVIGAQQALTGTLGTVVSNVVGLVTTLAVMIALEWRLTLLATIVLPLFVLPSRRVGRALQRLTREGMNNNAAMNTRMTERFNVSGAQLVALFGDPDHELEEFSGRAAKVRDIGVKSAMYGRIFFAALGLIGAVGTAVVYLVGGHLVLSEAATLGTVVAFAALLTQLYSPLMSLTNARVDLMTAYVSFERVFELLDLPSPLADRNDATPLAGVRGEIRFDEVVFRYPLGAYLESLQEGAPGEREQPIVLDGVSFVAAPGELVALVGPSGAGKTTIVSLVARLYDVTTGTVRVDGHDVREVRLDTLRRAIGVVTQDPHLFHESIAANLRYARRDATQAQIEAACRAAQIHDLVASLPEGYDTVVGERGYRLSGGEKQRLAIARVLLKDPAIVILDEATAHLDSENEVLIQAALATALAGRTSLVIAHRLSTIVAADRILVVGDGRIVQSGRHTELLGTAGLYGELYRTQYATGSPSVAPLPGSVAPEPSSV